MNKLTMTMQSVAALVFALCTLPVQAAPVFCEATGHYYEVFDADAIEWNDADLAANLKSYAGANGHLATITSADENACVEAARVAKAPSPPEVWIGGQQTTVCSPTAGCGWTWVNGEGPISTPQVPIAGSYSNWNLGEPNDNYGPSSEEQLTIGLNNQPIWNDEGKGVSGNGIVANIGGYAVEFETAVTYSGSQCVPSCVYNGIEYSVEIDDPENETIEFQSFLREDVDAACGNTTRNFEFSTVHGPVQTTMAKYLCGVRNPATGIREFVAVVVSKSFASQKAADVETDPSLSFPGFSLTCSKPIPAGIDLRDQDISHFATDYIGDMPRDYSADGTYDCGSSRGKTKGTILFVGTQYVFKDGAGNELDWNSNPESVEQAFIDVTRDRLEDWIQAIDEAKPAVPKKHLLRWLAMRVLAEFSLWAHDHGNFKLARLKANAANQILPTISFANNAAADSAAFIDIWGSHLIFMYDVKIIPYTK